MKMIIYKISNKVIPSICDKILNDIVKGTFEVSYSFVKLGKNNYIVQLDMDEYLSLGCNIIKQSKTRPISLLIENIGIQEHITNLQKIDDSVMEKFLTYSSSKFLNNLEQYATNEYDILDVYYNYLYNYFYQNKIKIKK